MAALALRRLVWTLLTSSLSFQEDFAVNVLQKEFIRTGEGDASDGQGERVLRIAHDCTLSYKLVACSRYGIEGKGSSQQQNPVHIELLQVALQTVQCDSWLLSMLEQTMFGARRAR